jgi:nuclease-like protein
VQTIELSDHPGDLLSAATRRREAAGAKGRGQLVRQRDAARKNRKWLTWLRLSLKLARYKSTLPARVSRPTDDEEILKAGIAGERQVARELGEKLGSDWTLVHGYRNGRGEIDYLLLGPHGLFAIEVKNNNATVSISGDVWAADKYDRYGNLRDRYLIEDRGGRSPSVQLNQSADALERFLRTRGQALTVPRIVTLTHARSRLGLHKNATVHVAVTTQEILQVVNDQPGQLDPKHRAALLALIRHDHAFHETRRQAKRR